MFGDHQLICLQTARRLRSPLYLKVGVTDRVALGRWRPWLSMVVTPLAPPEPEQLMGV